MAQIGVFWKRTWIIITSVMHVFRCTTTGEDGVIPTSHTSNKRYETEAFCQCCHLVLDSVKCNREFRRCVYRDSCACLFRALLSNIWGECSSFDLHEFRCVHILYTKLYACYWLIKYILFRRRLIYFSYIMNLRDSATLSTGWGIPVKAVLFLPLSLPTELLSCWMIFILHIWRADPSY
jgi:hypothetical protein